MASSVVIPFNNKPTSVSVKTTSYTIPAGSYAKIVVNLEGSATLTVDGTTALRGTQNSVLGSSPMVVGTAGAPNTLAANTMTALAVTGSAYSSATDQKTVISDLWVPTGTVINGTGTWRATVMLYTN